MLSSLQRRVATLFLAMPEASGFALGGGAALILHRVVARDSRYLDLFVYDRHTIRAAGEAFIETAQAHGLSINVVQSGPAFWKLNISDAEDEVAVDIGYDYRWQDTDDSEVGPVLSLPELGVDKMLALFGRAEARDVVDVFHLAQRLGIAAMVANASQKDPGFDPYYLAINIDLMDRHPREAFAVDDHTFAAMQRFSTELRAQLMEDAFNDPNPP